MIPIPQVVLVGRPNVGKSTLFNRICGRRKAITDGRPGSTRDRNYAQVSWRGAGFELVDTGGLLLQTDDPLLGPAAWQAERAIDAADVVILILDGRAGLLPDDQAIAARLRRSGKTLLVAVNKTESKSDQVSDFARLGFDAFHPISAEHGQGVGDLLDATVALLPHAAPAEDRDPDLSIALVGRPNVGKSSLLNRILGEDRAVVSAIPGTTRDAVDSILVKGNQRFRFVDTAGIRRVRLLKEPVDFVSVVHAKKSIERADVAVIVLDAGDGIREMDATIAGYVRDARRGAIFVVNKWDLARSRSMTTRGFERALRDQLKFLAYAPLLFVSAETGHGLGKMLDTATRVYAACRTRIATGPLNRLLAHATQAHAPKAARGGYPVRLLFGTQVGIAPPTFVLSLSHETGLHFSYNRYLENQLRGAFGFEGAPIVFRTRMRPH